MNGNPNMFYNATKFVFTCARLLRKNMTTSEKVLWDFLKKKPYGFKFRRQHAIGMYVVDFYCHSLKLVIEVDGSIHDLEENKFNDKCREKSLEEEGIRVIRFKNQEVMKHLSTVKAKLLKVLKELS